MLFARLIKKLTFLENDVIKYMNFCLVPDEMFDDDAGNWNVGAYAVHKVNYKTVDASGKISDSTLCFKKTFYYNFVKIALISIKIGTHNLHI